MLTPSKVRVTEVGPRDGLQNEDLFLPTADKIHLIKSLAQCGFEDIEASSFVHPRWIPQLTDAEEVFRGVQGVSGTMYALIPNLKGLERAVNSGVEGLTLSLSTTDSHSLKNLNRTTEKSLDGLAEIMREAGGTKVSVRASAATVFGCPFEGRPPLQRVLWVVDRLVDMGCKRIGLSDTIGVANPKQVYELMSTVLKEFQGIDFELHLHDTYGRGLANVIAGLEAGVLAFDSSIGGLGGCPYAPGASGNISTEDLVDMLHAMGIETGIDREKLLMCSQLVYQHFGKSVDSKVFKAKNPGLYDSSSQPV